MEIGEIIKLIDRKDDYCAESQQYTVEIEDGEQVTFLDCIISRTIQREAAVEFMGQYEYVATESDCNLTIVDISSFDDGQEINPLYDKILIEDTWNYRR